MEYSATFENGIDRNKDEDDATTPDGLDDIFYAINGMSWTPTPHAVRRLLVGNRELFDDDGCALSLIGSVLTIVSVPCLGFSQSFDSTPHLQSRATASEIKSIVGIIFDAANRKNGSQYYRTGVILMGMLAVAQDPPQEDIPATSAKAAKALAPADSEADAKVVAFAKLPQPQPGTLLSGVMEIIELSFESKVGEPVGPIAALQHISVPGEFADGFIDPLLQRGQVRQSCIALLGSQIRGRRRAVVDGKNFITFSARLARASEEEWVCWMGATDGPALSFIESFVGIGPKIPTDSLKHCLLGLSEKCRASQDQPRLLITLFVSIRGLLVSTALSPKSMAIIRSVMIGDIFPHLNDTPLHSLLEQRRETSVIKSFIDCMREIPLSLLDEATFFAKQVALDEIHSDVLRTLTVLELVNISYFNSARRDDQELSSTVSWISSRLTRSTANREEKDCLRRIAYSFAVASGKELSGAKRDRLYSLFEVLLLTSSENSSLGVEVLAVVLAVWCDGSGSDRNISLGYVAMTAATKAFESLTASALAQFFRVAVADLPYNLASFGREEKISAHISNYLHRLFTRWSSEAVEESTVASLRQAFFVCQTQRTQEDAFLAHASSFLATSA